MNRKIRSTCAGAVALLGLMASAPQALAQAKTEISLSRQPGIFYMPTHIIEKQKLIEKHVERNTVQRWGTQS
jgi:NitT/TauT family transport system substrate-binding protein